MKEGYDYCVHPENSVTGCTGVGVPFMCRWGEIRGSGEPDLEGFYICLPRSFKFISGSMRGFYFYFHSPVTGHEKVNPELTS